ncbi:signal peptidase II [Paenibacillus sp. MBLB4367]|uniref:signal peptidase II n=1 Tax=Paenibacillus sp. MBLB4367 TaxID=3384767 RepID=UPI0039082FBA
MFYFIIALVVFLLDQGSKWLVKNKMGLYESRPVIGEFFQITSHRNTGAAFSILEGQRWFFLLVTTVVVIGVVWYLLKMIKSNRKLLAWALCLLLGGAVGNFLDRALTGEVVDFLQFRFQFSLFGKAIDYTFAIFNLADSAIVIGVALIFLDAIRSWLQERRGNANESHGS